MDSLITYLQSKIILTKKDIDLVKKYFISEKIIAETEILRAGKTEEYIYFLEKGFVKGYQNIDGKIVIQHLVSKYEFFTSLDSFMTQTPSLDYFETITNCNVLKISKSSFDVLQKETTFWPIVVNKVTNEHLNCKLERVKDFQVLTAKERYLKFVKNSPTLALNISVHNMASFLGIEPQSLSRIRKQIAF